MPLTNIKGTQVKDQSIDTADLADKAVTLAKMDDMATASLIYRTTAGAGAPEVNTLTQVKTDLGLDGLVTNITAGKTVTIISTDTYDLTIPATGTAALLATANIFTETQSITVTNALKALSITGTIYSAAGGASLGGIYQSLSITGTAPTIGIFSSIARLSADEGYLSDIIGARFNTGIATTDRMGGASVAIYGLILQVYNASTGAGYTTALNAYDIYLSSMTSVSTNITNAYGIYITSITAGATLNYAIYTNLGIVRFGDVVKIGTTAGNTALQISGTLDAASSLAMNIVPTMTGTTVNYGMVFQPIQTSISASGFYGAYFNPSFNATAGGPQGIFYGICGLPSIRSTASQNVTTVYGIYTGVNNESAAGSVVANATAIYIQNPVATGAITNAKGIYIEAITSGGTSNYAIYTNAGLVRFGDKVGIGVSPSYPLDIAVASGAYGVQITGSVTNSFIFITPTVGFAGIEIAGTLDSNYGTGIYIHPTLTGTVSPSGMYFNPVLTAPAANFYGIMFFPSYKNTTAGTLTYMVGVYNNMSIDATTSRPVTNLYGELMALANNSTAGSVVTNAYGLYVNNIVATGAITNVYGIYVGAQTSGGTLNYSLYTNAGDIFFNNLGSKIGFFGTAPVVQPVATDDLGTALSNLGLRAAGRVAKITSGFGVAYACYDYATDGHGTGAVTPTITTNIPSGAIIVGGYFHVITSLTSAGTTTISWGTSAGASATIFMSGVAKATLVTDYTVATLTTWAAGTRMTAAGNIIITINTTALGAGKMELWVIYFMTGG